MKITQNLFYLQLNTFRILLKQFGTCFYNWLGASLLVSYLPIEISSSSYEIKCWFLHETFIASDHLNLPSPENKNLEI